MLLGVCRFIVCKALDFWYGYFEGIRCAGASATASKRAFAREVSRAGGLAQDLHQLRRTGKTQRESNEYSRIGECAWSFCGRVLYSRGIPEARTPLIGLTKQNLFSHDATRVLFELR